jgi:hypothetical protein
MDVTLYKLQLVEVYIGGYLYLIYLAFGPRI